MEIHRIISRFVNGESHSLVFSQKQLLRSITEDLIRLTGEHKFESFRHSYERLYGQRAAVRHEDKGKILAFVRNGQNADVFLKPLFEFVEYIHQNFDSAELVGAYVHGSLATNDYVPGYSDFDALLILRERVLNDPTLLLKVRSKIIKANTYLYLLDPLQHHNLFILTELDLQYYFEPEFPVVLFDYAREITSFGEELSFRCLEDKDYLESIFQSWINIFHHPEQYRWHKRTSFFVKHAVQSIIFLLLVYSQRKKGEYTYKKFVFDKVREDFSPSVWSLIERATEVRQQCPYRSRYPYGFRKFIGKNFHYRCLQILHRHLDRNNAPDMLNIMGENFLNEAWGLLECMKKTIYEK